MPSTEELTCALETDVCQGFSSPYRKASSSFMLIPQVCVGVFGNVKYSLFFSFMQWFKVSGVLLHFPVKGIPPPHMNWSAIHTKYCLFFCFWIMPIKEFALLEERRPWDVELAMCHRFHVQILGGSLSLSIVALCFYSLHDYHYLFIYSFFSSLHLIVPFRL